MFVDDEEFQVDLGRQMLERLGYKVDARASSIDAYELFRLYPDNFDMVITDMTMPNMTGDILAKKMLDIRPNLPIIICTGYSERITEDKVKIMGIKGLIMKPMVMKDVARMIREVLDG